MGTRPFLTPYSACPSTELWRRAETDDGRLRRKAARRHPSEELKRLAIDVKVVTPTRTLSPQTSQMLVIVDAAILKVESQLLARGRVVPRPCCRFPFVADILDFARNEARRFVQTVVSSRAGPYA